MHYKSIRAEGFEIHKLLSQCLKEKIELKNIKILSDYEFTADIAYMDWVRFNRIAGSRYHITVIREKGMRPLFTRLISNRATIAGLVLFFFIICLQTQFVSEIRVYGYEKLTEREILECLRDAGLYVGCSRSIDPDAVEIEMYRSLDHINWIGITFKGGLAEVTVSEGTEPINQADTDQPCDIVAIKDGYIEKTIAREGKEVVVKDDFVNVGDILISGIILVEDKTYSRDPDHVSYNYVHADGEVYAKTVHRYICYQDTYNLQKKRTGNKIPGIRLTIGPYSLNSSGLYVPYETSVYEEKEIFSVIWPFPIEFAFNSSSEVELYRWERDQEDIEKQANRQVRELIQSNLPESAQILNKSLMFSSGENIIKVTVIIEALEQIGEKRSFIPPSVLQQE